MPILFHAIGFLFRRKHCVCNKHCALYNFELLMIGYLIQSSKPHTYRI